MNNLHRGRRGHGVSVFQFFRNRYYSEACDEYDEKLCGILKRVLSEKGAKKTKEWWGLVGAQEMSFYVYMIGDEEITVEQETYIGLSIKGPEKLVREIAEEVSRPSKQEARDVK